MVNNSISHDNAQLNLIFSALSDPTRRAVTKHVKVLEKAGLLRRTIDGRTHHCRLAVDPLHAASDWMAFYQKFWHTKLDALDSYLLSSEKDKS